MCIRVRCNIYWIYGIIVGIVLLMLMFGNNNFNTSTDTHSFYDFQNKYLNSGSVEKITIVNHEIAEVKLNATASSGTTSPSSALSAGKEELLSLIHI